MKNDNDSEICRKTSSVARHPDDVFDKFNMPIRLIIEFPFFAHFCLTTRLIYLYSALNTCKTHPIKSGTG